MSNDNAIVQLFTENFIELEKKKQKYQQHYPESGVRRRLISKFIQA